MSLDSQTMNWIESAISNIDNGVVRLIISEKRIAKIITEDHRNFKKTKIEKSNPAEAIKTRSGLPRKGGGYRERSTGREAPYHEGE